MLTLLCALPSRRTDSFRVQPVIRSEMEFCKGGCVDAKVNVKQFNDEHIDIFLL